jgi:hypothetical protein
MNEGSNREERFKERVAQRRKELIRKGEGGAKISAKRKKERGVS